MPIMTLLLLELISMQPQLQVLPQAPNPRVLNKAKSHVLYFEQFSRTSLGAYGSYVRPSTDEYTFRAYGGYVGPSTDEYLQVLKTKDELFMMGLEFLDGQDELICSTESAIARNRAAGREKEAQGDEELLVILKRTRSNMLKWQVGEFPKQITSCEKTITYFRDKGDEKNAKKRELVLKQFKETLAKLEAREKKLKEGEKAEEKLIAPAPREVRS